MSCFHGYESTPSRLMIEYQDLFHRTDRARDALLRQWMHLQERIVTTILVVDLFALAKRSYTNRHTCG